MAEAWYYLSADHVASWLGSSADPFQPIVIPFNIGAIACIYLIGVALVDRRRSTRTRAIVQSGSDNSYGVYLAQLLFITVLSWLGWRHLNDVVPWPLVSVLTVVIVFVACVGLTELLARTPLAKPLTGRTRVAVAPHRRGDGGRPLPVGRHRRRLSTAIRSRRPLRRRVGRPGDGGAIDPVAGVVGVGVGAEGRRTHIQVSAQVCATLVGTMPSPGRQ